MSIQPYSLCPGGKAKKIKFCCRDLVSDVIKIIDLLGAKQYLACLERVDRLLARHPDRACLLAAKTLVLRVLGRLDECAEVAAVLLEKHPESPVALAESAVVATGQKGCREAIDLVQRGLRHSEGVVPVRLYAALGVVAQRCLAEGEYLAGRALCLLQATLNREDERPARMVAELLRARRVPLLVKTDTPWIRCPDDVPWKRRFAEAMERASYGLWQETARTLEELLAEAPDEPAIWENLARCRCFLADREGAITALERLSTLDVPLEDAAEAAALARLLSADPLGDMYDVVNLRYRAGDVEHLHAVFSASSRIEMISADLGGMTDEGEPPPRAAFWILDRTKLRSPQDLSPKTIPQALCQAFLFGRQTDREARLEIVGCGARYLDSVQSLLSQLGGDELGPDPEQEVIDRESATEEVMTQTWRLPDGVQLDQIRRLSREHLDEALLEAWPQLPLGILDGKTPEEAAGQEAYRVKLLAALLVVQSWLEPSRLRFDFNRLRCRLGLPELGPVDPAQQKDGGLPLIRLARLDVEKLDPEALIKFFHQAMMFRATEALERLAREIARRPDREGTDEQMEALAVLAPLVEDTQEALEYVERGRQDGRARRHSCAPWDLHELRLRFQRLEADEATRLLGHIAKAHAREPGVTDAVTEILMEFGVLDPHSRPTAQHPAPGPEKPAIVVPGQAPARPGNVWAPGDPEPGRKKPQLWTPDSG